MNQLPAAIRPYRDEDFLRIEGIPLTKQMIRAGVFAKLCLPEGAVFYDIGSGTGSIAVTAASAPTIKVYAFERHADACALIRRNGQRLGVEHLTVIEGEAPESLTDALQMDRPPTHAFVGGSDGKWRDIITSLYKSNPSCKVVMTALTMETVSDVLQTRELFNAKLINADRITTAEETSLGRYHTMRSSREMYLFTWGGIDP